MPDALPAKRPRHLNALVPVKYFIIESGLAASLCSGKTCMPKAKKRRFSIVKAVKANARDRVGIVPPERVIPDPKLKAATKPKHKKTLADLLSGADDNA